MIKWQASGQRLECLLCLENGRKFAEAVDLTPQQFLLIGIFTFLIST